MIYFIRDSLTTHIKIGVAKDPWRRLSTIQTNAAGRLELLAIDAGDRGVESALHQRFAHLRLRGEWFEGGVDLCDHIATLPPAIRPKAGKTRGFWNGMSAREVGRATGLSAAHLSLIQSRGRGCSPEVAIRLQDLTGISAVSLVFGDLADRAVEGHLASIAKREAA